jgi:HSP20 family molecular chaperone IbpA
MAELPVRRERREAAPARWDLFGELEEMRARTEQLFERLLGGDLGFHRGLWSPPVDLEETDEAWVVEAELPGVKKGDVTVELGDNELAIHGEVTERERRGTLRRPRGARANSTTGSRSPASWTPTPCRHTSKTACSRCGSPSRRPPSPSASTSRELDPLRGAHARPAPTRRSRTEIGIAAYMWIGSESNLGSVQANGCSEGLT